MRFSGFFVVSFLITSAFALPTADPIPEINAETTSLQILTETIQSFNKTTAGLNSVYKAAQDLLGTTTAAAKTVLTYPPFTPAQSQANLAAARVFVTKYQEFCDTFVAKKTDFAQVHGGLEAVQDDIKALASPAFAAAISAFIARTPFNDIPKFLAISKQMAAMLKTIQHAYGI